MHCSVIIPCHGRSDLTRACVQSLLAQGPEWDLEILLVDNQSPDDTRSLATLHPSVRVLPQPRNLGFAGGVNAGLREARHPWLLVLNNDTQAAPELLTRLHRALTREPNVGLAAPVSNRVKGRACLPLGNQGATAEGRAAIADQLQQEFGGLVEDTDYLSGLCLLVARSTLAELGPFDERFGAGNFEDDDLSLRARLRGLRLVIARDAFLHHEGHATFQALGFDYGQWLASRRELFTAKWRHDPAGEALLAEQAGDLARAADAAGRALWAYPRWAGADWILARAAADAGRTADAITHLRAFLDACPRHPGAALRLVTLLARQGQATAAAAALEHALLRCAVTAADLAGTHRELGELARERGNLGEAEISFRTGLELSPDDGPLQLLLGVTLLEQDRPRDALQPLRRAAERGQPMAHSNLGICWHRLGDPAEALRQCAEAARLLPDDPTVRHNLAAALQAAQRVVVAAVAADQARLG